MKPITTIAAAIFLLMALLHLYRIAVGFPIMIGGTSVGQNVSWVGLIVTAGLAIALFREARRSALAGIHDITLTATSAGPGLINITGEGRRILPRGSGWHHFKFRLDDQTTENVRFGALTAADACSTCPPVAGSPNTQIWDDKRHNSPPHGQPRRAEFKDRNNNKPAMDVSYQWEFTCDDPAITVTPFDPIISNGGRV